MTHFSLTRISADLSGSQQVPRVGASANDIPRGRRVESIVSATCKELVLLADGNAMMHRPIRSAIQSRSTEMRVNNNDDDDVLSV